jgi:hypothetical protein
LYLLPGINVEVAGGTVNAFIGKLQNRHNPGFKKQQAASYKLQVVYH